MSRPLVKQNTYIQTQQKSIYNAITILFFIVGTLIGIDRYSLIDDISLNLKIFVRIYVSIFNLTILTLIYSVKNNPVYTIIKFCDVIQHFMCIILAYICHAELRNFFVEIKKVDEKLFCPTVSDRQVKLFAFGFFTLFFLVLGLFLLPCRDVSFGELLLPLIPTDIGHITEMYFFAYLLNIVWRRIQHINQHLERLLSKEKCLPSSTQKNSKSSFGVCTLIDSYHITMNAINILNKAVKWSVSIYNIYK